MKRAIMLVMVGLALSLVPVSAGVPIVQIQAPRQVTAGDEVTLKIMITHEGNDNDHHINYVWLYQNDRMAKEWVWTVDDYIKDDQFTLEYTTILTEDTVFLAKAHCTLHGDKKITFKIDVVPYVPKPKAIIVANDIDFSRASSLVGFLENNGFEAVRVTASEFEAYKAEGLIIILGGADAPDGIGEIVRSVLDERKQELTRLGIRYFIEADVWTPNQRVFVFAGRDRDETKEAHTQYRDKILE
ncbi:MAG: desulfoferrodoxin family protein [Candidatus Methanofastidiosia archaeon]